MCEGTRDRKQRDISYEAQFCVAIYQLEPFCRLTDRPVAPSPMRFPLRSNEAAARRRSDALLELRRFSERSPVGEPSDRSLGAGGVNSIANRDPNRAWLANSFRATFCSPTTRH